MKTFHTRFIIGILAFLTLTASAVTRYVDLNSASPMPPYTDWSTAATNIQDAVDASIGGDLILVTNGVYRNGGRVAASGAVTNRVAVTKAVIMRSVNGPEMTVIEGYQVPGSTNGNSAIRCLYLTNGAKFIGFTLTNGATSFSIPNLYDRSGGGAWCASTNAYMSNCVISGNVGYFYGGVYGGTLDRCIVAGNRSTQGNGGVYDCRLVNCILTRNLGAAASSSTLVNCTIADNFSEGYVVSASKLYNCIVYYNGSAGNWISSVLTNCCAVQPPAGSGNITNPPQFLDFTGGDFRLQSGSPCINFGDNSYIRATVDFDGSPRVADDVVDMGAYEYQLPVPFGVEIQAAATNAVTTYPLEFKCQFTGGLPLNLVWNFGDGITASNQSSVVHSWSLPGDFLVGVTAYKSAYPNGVSAVIAVHVAPQIIHYVCTSSTTPVAPFLSWNTAATHIQAAVDAASTKDAVVVTNGIYQSGQTFVLGDGTYNRLVVAKDVIVRSVNGPSATMIRGYQIPGAINGSGAIRCVYLGSNATLSGFTLTGGATHTNVYSGLGGGAKCESQGSVLSNCVIAGNAGISGGGTFSGTLHNCVVSNNVAQASGGGGCNGVYNNCLFTGNLAASGGAVAVTAGAEAALNSSTVVSNAASIRGGGLSVSGLFAPAFLSASNSIVFGNYATNGPNYAASSPSDILWNNCCSIPIPAYGDNNFSFNPLLVDPSYGNYRLQSGSPCINAGKNTNASGFFDLDGRPRVVASKIDMGAYEFQGAGMPEFLYWLGSHGLPTDGSVDFADNDNDVLNTWQEWIAGTDPTNNLSVLKMGSPASDASGVVVTWQSIDNKTYFLDRATALAAKPSFSNVASNIVGQVGTTTYTDTNAIGDGPFFYRVGVQE